jgi:hypothetical protein
MHECPDHCERSRSWLLALAVAVVSALVATIGLWTYPRQPHTTARMARGGATLPQRLQTAIEPASPLLELPAPPPIAQGKDAKPPESAAAAMAQTRDAYRLFAKFPPWSRPAEPQYQELYSFNQLPIHTQQVIGMVDRSEIYANVTLDRGFIEPGLRAQIIAECWIVDDAGQRRRIEYSAIAEVHLALLDPAAQLADTSPFMIGWERVAGEISLDSSPNPLRREGVLDVSRFATLADNHRAARLVVRFSPQGDDPRPLELPFIYSTQAPFKIVSVVSDGIVNGSLEFVLDVDVVDLAPVRIRAALARPGEQNTPIAIYDRPIQPSKRGRQRTSITFFGKTLHDAQKDGPYQLFRIHGQSMISNVQIPEVFWADDRTFLSKPYKASQFASAEWSDPEKNQKLQLYEQMIEELSELPSVAVP